MLRGEFESAGESSPAELRTGYDELLREAIDRTGADAVADEAGVERETVQAFADGESPDVTLETAAAILGADPEQPDADAVEAEARDILLMGMTTAVLDVDAVAARLDRDMDAKEIQQKIEGRHPVSLDEYAALHALIASEK